MRGTCSRTPGISGSRSAFWRSRACICLSLRVRSAGISSTTIATNKCKGPSLAFFFMNKIFFILLIAACIPLLASASSIESTTEASADSSGGGAASAEARTTTNGGSGSVRVEVQTDRNGVVERRSFTNDGGGDVTIKMATSTRSRGGAAEARARIFIGGEGATSSRERPPRPFSVATSTGRDIPFLIHASSTPAPSRLGNFLKRLFSFFRFF